MLRYDIENNPICKEDFSMKKLIIAVVFIIVIFAVGTYFIENSDAYKIQKEIAQEIILNVGVK